MKLEHPTVGIGDGDRVDGAERVPDRVADDVCTVVTIDCAFIDPSLKCEFEDLAYLVLVLGVLVCFLSTRDFRHGRRGVEIYNE